MVWVKLFIIMDTSVLIGSGVVRRFPRHKKNLALVEGFDSKFYLRSYATFVARVEGESLIELGKWSITTSRHVWYAAYMLGLERVKGY